MKLSQANNLWDKLTPEEQERIKAFKAREDKQRLPSVSEYEQIVAVFGYYFGWEGVLAMESNNISGDKAYALIRGVRAEKAARLSEQAQAIRVAVNGKKNEFEKLIKQIENSY